MGYFRELLAASSADQNEKRERDKGRADVPPEVIWGIACGCKRKHYYPRETLVEEDDLGEVADWLIAINSGKADVEKLAYNGEEAVPQLIGTLTEGAVLGDVCFLHGMVPRGATVRAQTEVDAIAIPPSVSW
eukprot:Skav212370  [mRNA]  locus=scaffold1983:14854:17149:+ [translate_table: standard]